MNITFNNLFSKYLLDPTSEDLYLHQKIGTSLLSAAVQISTLGTATIVGACLKKSKERNYVEIEEQNKLFKEITQTCSSIYNKYQEDLGPIKRNDIPNHIQNFINQNYAQKLPSEESVTIPNFSVNGEKFLKTDEEMIKWSALSQKEKVLYYNHFAFPDHKKLPDNIIGYAVVDRMFFALNGQMPFLEKDPREHHGLDHCARTALFSAIFAYLYAKYHPDYSPEEVMNLLPLIQIVGAGHDSKRQNEGVDVYDEISADHTVEYLKDWGIIDPNILQDCHDAIEHKDSHDLKNKSLIAKCVQNADCAEYARLWLWSGKQNSDDFEVSRQYLDIFNEFNQGCNFKNNYNKEDFLKELNAIRLEMNRLIYYTHKKRTREKLAGATNYYNELLKLITPSRYSLLNNILKDMGIIKETERRSILEREILNQAQDLLNQGLNYVSNKFLLDQIQELRKIDGQEKESLIEIFTHELIKRKTAKQAFKLTLGNLILNHNIEERDLQLLISQYAALPPLQKDKLRLQLVEFLRGYQVGRKLHFMKA